MGAVYSIVGVGFSLIFGVMQILNFAYGEFYMLASYMIFFLYGDFHFPLLWASLIVISTAFVAGIVTEKALIKPLRNKGGNWVISVIIATLGLQIVLQNLARLLWGGTYRGIPAYFTGSVRLGVLIASNERLFIFLVSLLVLLGIWLLINRSKLGLAIVATAQNKEAAKLAGIHTDRIYTITFGISIALISIAAILLMPILYVYPTVGVNPIMKAFAVTLLGGMGNITGAIFSGFILGIAESLAGGYISAATKDLVVFLVIIIILTFYPSGVGGFIVEMRAKWHKG